jgi:hypothetical protein
LTWVALRSPWEGDVTSHYISGPLLDPVSGAFVLVGIVVGVLAFWRAPWRWVWIWVALAVLAGGATSQYERLPNSRSFFFLPPLLLLGGLAIGLAARFLRRQNVPAGAIALVGATFAGAALYYNHQRLWVETPAKLHQIPEAVAAMASEANRCRDGLAGPLFLGDGPEPVFEKLADAYGWTGKIQIKKAPAPLDARDLAFDRCIIAFGLGGAATGELERLAASHGRTADLRWATDGAGNRRALFLRWSGQAPPTQTAPNSPPAAPTEAPLSPTPRPAPTPYQAPPPATPSTPEPYPAGRRG